jgi:hypothetical protein
MSRFTYDPASGLMLPHRALPRVGKQLCDTFTVGPGFFAGAAPVAGTIWDLTAPTNYTSHTSSYTISDSGRGLQENTSQAFQFTMKATTAKTTGKWYFECVITFPGAFAYIGVVDAAAACQNVVVVNGVTTNKDCSWRSNGQSFNSGNTFNGSFGAWTTGDVLGCALDIGGATVKFYRNNTLAGTVSRTMGASMTIFASSDQGQAASGPYKWLLQLSAAQCTFSPPSGYSNWD